MRASVPADIQWAEGSSGPGGQREGAGRGRRKRVSGDRDHNQATRPRVGEGYEFPEQRAEGEK